MSTVNEIQLDRQSEKPDDDEEGDHVAETATETATKEERYPEPKSGITCRDDVVSDYSRESWDAYIDNWTDLYAEKDNELPRMQIDRRRMVAAAKLRVLIQKLDEDLRRTILQMGSQEMERLIVADVDAATGYLATARKLGKPTLQELSNGEVKSTTERVKYIERSKAMVGIFNNIVRSHDNQLYRAVHKLTEEQRDRIVRANHEQFSGFHRQQKRKEGAADPASKPGGRSGGGHNRDFVTPRVKSAAKSRRAIALLNSIVDAKDDLLREAIVSMDRSARNHLISRNNDSLKFEEQRKKQRAEFAMTRKTTTAAEHEFATERVKQVVRAKTASEVFQALLQAQNKKLTTMIKKLPKPDKDGFLKQQSGGTKDTLQQRKTEAIAIPKRRPGGKSMIDTARYVRGEVMVLRRRVTEDVKNAIEAKDRELEKFVADMDDGQLERTLSACVPSGADDLCLWKQDRQKKAWKRLSAFGLVRDDPSLYRQWKQQTRKPERAEQAGKQKESTMLCTTRAADVNRRQPWSTDLHYVRRVPPRRGRRVPQEETRGGLRGKEEDRPRSADTRERCSEAGLRHLSGGVVIARARPISASPIRRGAVARPKSGVRRPPKERPATARSPGLACLARVFYQSSVALSTTGGQQVSGATENVHDRGPLHSESTLKTTQQLSHSHQERPLSPREPTSFDDGGCFERKSRGGDEAIGICSQAWPDTISRLAVSTTWETGDARSIPRVPSRPPDTEAVTHSVEGQHEKTRLLLAASQLSAEAVTRRIMSGYLERERAREPNRSKRTDTMRISRKRQPPSEN